MPAQAQVRRETKATPVYNPISEKWHATYELTIHHQTMTYQISSRKKENLKKLFDKAALKAFANERNGPKLPSLKAFIAGALFKKDYSLDELTAIYEKNNQHLTSSNCGKIQKLDDKYIAIFYIPKSDNTEKRAFYITKQGLTFEQAKTQILEWEITRLHKYKKQKPEKITELLSLFLPTEETLAYVKEIIARELSLEPHRKKDGLPQNVRQIKSKDGAFYKIIISDKVSAEKFTTVEAAQEALVKYRDDSTQFRAQQRAKRKQNGLPIGINYNEQKNALSIAINLAGATNPRDDRKPRFSHSMDTMSIPATLKAHDKAICYIFSGLSDEGLKAKFICKGKYQAHALTDVEIAAAKLVSPYKKVTPKKSEYFGITLSKNGSYTVQKHTSKYSHLLVGQGYEVAKTFNPSKVPDAEQQAITRVDSRTRAMYSALNETENEVLAMRYLLEHINKPNETEIALAKKQNYTKIGKGIYEKNLSEAAPIAMVVEAAPASAVAVSTETDALTSDQEDVRRRALIKLTLSRAKNKPRASIKDKLKAIFQKIHKPMKADIELAKTYGLESIFTERSAAAPAQEAPTEMTVEPVPPIKAINQPHVVPATSAASAASVIASSAAPTELKKASRKRRAAEAFREKTNKSPDARPEKQNRSEDIVTPPAEQVPRPRGPALRAPSTAQKTYKQKAQISHAGKDSGQRHSHGFFATSRRQRPSVNGNPLSSLSQHEHDQMTKRLAHLAGKRKAR